MQKELSSKQVEAKTLIKSINRHIRRKKLFEGGLQYGLDYPTWSFCYPQMSKILNEAAKIITGRDGFYLPKYR
jgi:hypothetical protein